MLNEIYLAHSPRISECMKYTFQDTHDLGNLLQKEQDTIFFNDFVHCSTISTFSVLFKKHFLYLELYSSVLKAMMHTIAPFTISVD